MLHIFQRYSIAIRPVFEYTSLASPRYFTRTTSFISAQKSCCNRFTASDSIGLECEVMAAVQLRTRLWEASIQLVVDYKTVLAGHPVSCWTLVTGGYTESLGHCLAASYRKWTLAMARKTNLLGAALLFIFMLGTGVAAPVGNSEEVLLQSIRALSHGPDTTSQPQGHAREGERMEDEGRGTYKVPVLKLLFMMLHCLTQWIMQPSSWLLEA